MHVKFTSNGFCVLLKVLKVISDWYDFFLAIKNRNCFLINYYELFYKRIDVHIQSTSTFYSSFVQNTKVICNVATRKKEPKFVEDF
jgi:hypothetical protein